MGEPGGGAGTQGESARGCVVRVKERVCIRVCYLVDGLVLLYTLMFRKSLLCRRLYVMMYVCN
jgi:hypothetical protein